MPIRRSWTDINWPAACYSFLPALLALRYVNAPPDPRTYGPSHWFLNYHHGFMRRAFVGQAFSSFSFLSWRSIFLIEAAVVLCLVLVTYAAFRNVLFGSLEERRFAAFLFAAPAFFPHMAYMGGEIDNFMYIPLLLAAWALMHLHNYLGLILATIFVCIGLAMHEGFLLMFYPLIFVLLVELLHRRVLKPAWVGLHGMVVAACFFFIVVAGKLRGTQPGWMEEAQHRTDMPIEGTVFLALHNSFSEQVHFAVHHYSYLLLRGIVVTLVLCIPYGVVLWRLVKGSVQSRGYSAALQRAVLLTFFIPLMLIPLGHDAMRWLAALCIDMSLYALFIYQADVRSERRAEANSALMRWSANPAIGATFLYLVVLGPWGLAGTRLLANISGVLKR